MTLEKFLLALLATWAMAACAPKEAAEEAPTAEQPAAAPGVAAPSSEEPAAEAPAADECRSADYQSFVGSNVAAITLPADLPHRIYKEGDPITMDYRADRLNIVTDADGVIIEVKCG